MNYLLYMNIVLIFIHCICAVLVYGIMMNILAYRHIRGGTQAQWRTHRAIVLVLAICIPILTTVVIYVDPDLRGEEFRFIFFYPYDDLQQQECDDTHLVDIWTDGRNMTKHIKADWERLNERFKDFRAHINDTG